MTKLSSFLYVIILAAILSVNPIACSGESKQENAHKLLFVIGDSLFDPGNNQYLNASKKGPETSWPYGMNFNNHSSGRVSDGRIVPDFIALFAKLHMLPPYLQPGANLTDGANFASAGSGCLGMHPGVMNLKIQLANLKKVAKSLSQELGEKTAKEVLMKSVYLFSMGGVDYFNFNTNYPNATKSKRIKYVQMVIGNLTMALKEIYVMGGRKFAFQNVGPLGCVPIINQIYPQLNGRCEKRIFLSHARMHNKALSNIMKKLELNLNGFKYSIFDYYHALGDRIHNAPKYGFKEGKIACCGKGQFNGRNCGGNGGKEAYNLCKNPNEYVFFDGRHTTERTNNQLAELLWSGVPNITGPLNIKQLFELS